MRAHFGRIWSKFSDGGRELFPVLSLLVSFVLRGFYCCCFYLQRRRWCCCCCYMFDMISNTERYYKVVRCAQFILYVKNCERWRRRRCACSPTVTHIHMAISKGKFEDQAIFMDNKSLAEPIRVTTQQTKQTFRRKPHFFWSRRNKTLRYASRIWWFSWK